MRVSNLRAKTFKSLADVEVAVDPSMTVLVGANNVGKSAILDALMFMSQTAMSNAQRYPHLWPPLQERGGFANVAHGKDATRTMSLDVEFLSDGGELGLALAVGERHQANIDEPVSCRFSVSLGADQFDEFGVLATVRGVDVGFPSPGLWERVRKDVEGLGRLELDLAALKAYLGEFRYLQSFRRTPDEIGVEGTYRLRPDGSNLVQVLNSLASGDRRTYERIVGDLGALVPGVDELRAPLAEGRNVAYGAITETAFEGVEFQWPHVSAGTREIIMILTLVHTAPSPGLVLIEEPEARIHSAALAKLLDILEDVAAKQGKQFIITTHSPLVVDCVSPEKVLLVSKREGRTSVARLSESVGKLARQGVLLGWLVFPGRRALPHADFLLIVEGRDDVKIWDKFLDRRPDLNGRVALVKGENGGGEEAGRMGAELKVFSDMGLASVPFLVLRDSDNDKAGKEAALKQQGLVDAEFHVLERKEIEDYLIDSKAIAAVANKSEDEVQEAIAASRGPGKQKLENVLKHCGIGTTDVGIKLAVIANMASLPDEIEGILDGISKAVRN